MQLNEIEQKGKKKNGKKKKKKKKGEKGGYKRRSTGYLVHALREMGLGRAAPNLRHDV